MNLNGTGTVIAILDTTIHQEFPSFTGKEFQIIDCLPDVPVASCEHGTICSAVAVGLQNDSTPRGVAPCAQLIVYRIAEGEIATIKAIIDALDDIQNKLENGIQIDVVSISYDCDENSKDTLCDKIEKLTEMGITFVAAAGNRGLYQGRACIPARFDNVISVGALDGNGKRAPYTPPVEVDVYAPGMFPAGYNVTSGTSFAAPAVAGLVLLLKQWANFIGLPAKENINRVDVLRKIFSEYMFVESDSTEELVGISQPTVKKDSYGKISIFQPVDFFMNMKDQPEQLNVIVQKHLDDIQRMEL